MIAQTATKIRSQMARFSGNLSQGLCKPARRFVDEMIYGIQARQSVHLTEIGRSLGESIPLIKTENRLSRNLARKELRPVLQDAVVKEGSSRIGKDSLLVLDLSEIVKPYAEKMENLARVRDGSKNELANGYWTCHVVGVENEGHEITPLYGELYSQNADDFISENHQIIKSIDKVSAGCEQRGIWVIDRGGDRRELYHRLVSKDRGLRFIVRQTGKRHVLFGNNQLSEKSVAAGCPLPYATTVVRETKGGEKVYRIEYGFRRVRLPEHPEVDLWLVVVTGFGDEPMLLLTDIPMRRNRKVLWRIVSAYITRWRIEETIRFSKQCYQVEDVRVMTYDRLQNMIVLVTCAMFFACVVLGNKLKLKILASHILKASKRLFGIPDFRWHQGDLRPIPSRNLRDSLRPHTATNCLVRILKLWGRSNSKHLDIIIRNMLLYIHLDHTRASGEAMILPLSEVFPAIS
jgi:hypothetical protein